MSEDHVKHGSIILMHFELVLIYHLGIKCPDPGVIVNGTRTGGILYGDTLTFQCYPGFDLVGDTQMVCRADGTWDGTKPRCNRMCLSIYVGLKMFFFM